MTCKQQPGGLTTCNASEYNLVDDEINRFEGEARLANRPSELRSENMCAEGVTESVTGMINEE